MKVLRAPEFEKFLGDPEKVDMEDVAGICILTTGHLAVRTWSQGQRFSFDLYSSRKFDYQRVEDLLKDGLCVTRRASHWTTRNWP
jgi:hypothetical protein